MTKIPNPEQAQQEKDDRHGGGGGEVSEVSTMEDPQTPIQPDQSVAGGSDEAGGVEEGAQGPNANPNAGSRKT
jgi:hypothetical protein